MKLVLKNVEKRQERTDQQQEHPGPGHIKTGFSAVNGRTAETVFVRDHTAGQHHQIGGNKLLI